MEYSDKDLEDAASLRAAVHEEALAKVRRYFPYADKATDHYSTMDYLQQYWDYPGAWYTRVAIPEEFKSRDECVNEIVKNTLEYYRKKS